MHATLNYRRCSQCAAVTAALSLSRPPALPVCCTSPTITVHVRRIYVYRSYRLAMTSCIAEPVLQHPILLLLRYYYTYAAPKVLTISTPRALGAHRLA